jgi:hypothetical protein
MVSEFSFSAIRQFAPEFAAMRPFVSAYLHRSRHCVIIELSHLRRLFVNDTLLDIDRSIPQKHRLQIANATAAQ